MVPVTSPPTSGSATLSPYWAIRPSIPVSVSRCAVSVSMHPTMTQELAECKSHIASPSALDYTYPYDNILARALHGKNHHPGHNTGYRPAWKIEQLSPFSRQSQRGGPQQSERDSYVISRWPAGQPDHSYYARRVFARRILLTGDRLARQERPGKKPASLDYR